MFKKVAIVTEGTCGIGRSIAQRLAMDGFVVVLSYSREQAEAMSLMTQINRLGGDAIALQADVANHIGAELLFRHVKYALGSIDVVVCNTAAVPLWSFDTLTSESPDIAIAKSLRATLLVLAQAANEVAVGGSIIVALSGVLDMFSQAGAPTGMFVERVEARAHALANQLRRRNITVNVIARGPLDSASSVSGRAMADARVGDERQHSFREQPDVAGVVSLLAGPDGHLVNSQLLYADAALA